MEPCKKCGNDLCDCESDTRDNHEQKLSDMKRKHPGYSNEAYGAAMFIGQDYPYVPVDD